MLSHISRDFRESDHLPFFISNGIDHSECPKATASLRMRQPSLSNLPSLAAVASARLGKPRSCFGREAPSLRFTGETRSNRVTACLAAEDEQKQHVRLCDSG